MVCLLLKGNYAYKEGPLNRRTLSRPASNFPRINARRSFHRGGISNISAFSDAEIIWMKIEVYKFPKRFIVALGEVVLFLVVV